ncbi:hypothetical protein [Parafrankia sp. EUN1f]|uniref:hypothetical protein n=1 Tax=Parafrankia sp. EUN1f TaxID=102897 RepID=UPI0005674D58|nr:hypothetical protein [Parafrankia sp. EUN1f]
MSLYLEDMLVSDDDIAARAAHRFLSPALHRRVRSVVRAYDPASCHCHDSRICAFCEALADDILLTNYQRIRKAACGDLPQTRAGEVIREWQSMIRSLRDPAGAGAINADHAGGLLAAYAPSTVPAGGARSGKTTSEEEHVWLRPAWAQLVNYPTRMLGIELRRRAAVRRGLPARPMRSLDASPVAGRLRMDPVADSALREFVVGLWAQVADPYDLPETSATHGVSAAQAGEALDRGRALLRRHDLPLDTVLLANPLAERAGPESLSALDGDRLVARPDEHCTTVEQARAEITARISGELTGIAESRHWNSKAPMFSHGPLVSVLRSLVDLAEGSRADPAKVCRGMGGIGEDAARREVSRLAVLLSEAGIAWLDGLLTGLERSEMCGARG